MMEERCPFCVCTGQEMKCIRYSSRYLSKACPYSANMILCGVMSRLDAEDAPSSKSRVVLRPHHGRPHAARQGPL